MKNSPATASSGGRASDGPAMDLNGYWVFPHDAPTEGDRYFEFETGFCLERDNSEVRLRVACGGWYAVWIDDELLGSGPFPSWPEQAFVDEWELPWSLAGGNHCLRFTLYCPGTSTSRYCRGSEGLFFSLTAGTTILASSSPGSELRWRHHPGYQVGLAPLISPQMGRSFFYDAAEMEAAQGKEWQSLGSPDYTPLPGMDRSFRPRPIERETLGDREQGILREWGYFRIASPGGRDSFGEFHEDPIREGKEVETREIEFASSPCRTVPSVYRSLRRTRETGFTFFSIWVRCVAGILSVRSSVPAIRCWK